MKSEQAVEEPKPKGKKFLAAPTVPQPGDTVQYVAKEGDDPLMAIVVSFDGGKAVLKVLPARATLRKKHGGEIARVDGAVLASDADASPARFVAPPKEGLVVTTRTPTTLKGTGVKILSE